MIVSVAEAARIRARIADLARLRRAGPGDRRPSAEELDDCAPRPAAGGSRPIARP